MTSPPRHAISGVEASSRSLITGANGSYLTVAAALRTSLHNISLVLEFAHLSLCSYHVMIIREVWLRLIG